MYTKVLDKSTDVYYSDCITLNNGVNDMINPNATSLHYGRVIEVSRSKGNNSLTLKVLLASGHMVEELGFIYHKTIKAGDLVACVIGFSIMSDRYGVKNIRRLRRDNKQYDKINTKVSKQSPFNCLKQNLKAV